MGMQIIKLYDLTASLCSNSYFTIICSFTQLMLSIPNVSPNGDPGFKQFCAVLLLSVSAVGCAWICNGLTVFSPHVFLRRGRLVHNCIFAGGFFSPNNAIYTELLLYLFPFS